jgi:hypothetical protein
MEYRPQYPDRKQRKRHVFGTMNRILMETSASMPPEHISRGGRDVDEK